MADALWLALACLVAAGAMDSISGRFRSTIWNETIPAHLRGRLAGIETLSWSSGPTLGGAAVIRIAGRGEEGVRRPPCTRGCVAKVTNATGAGMETASWTGKMIHEFMYPKVTPVRPGTGGSAGAPKPSATGASGGRRATA